MYEVLIQCFQKQMEISTLRIMEYWPAQKPGDLQMDFSNLQKKSISLSVCYIKNIFRPLLSIKNPLCTIIKANSIDSNFTLHDEWVCCSVYSLHWLCFWFNLLVWIRKFKWLFVRLIVWKNKFPHDKFRRLLPHCAFVSVVTYLCDLSIAVELWEWASKCVTGLSESIFVQSEVAGRGASSACNTHVTFSFSTLWEQHRPVYSGGSHTLLTPSVT